MSNIRIVTDTACDIDLKTAEKNNIVLLPFTITADGKEYREAYDITKLDFYKMLPDFKEIPKTAQITPYVFSEVIKKAYKDEVRDLIIFTINKGGSSTFASAIGAKKQFFIETPEAKATFNIHIVDTNTYSYGYGYAVLTVAEMVKKEENISKILTYIEDWFSRLELYFTIFDLTYAKKSGRIGTAAAIAGELLGIKPIIKLTLGASVTYQKVRGQTKALEALVNIAKEKIAADKNYFILSASNDNDEAEFEKMVKTEFKIKPMVKAKIGSAVAINSGLQLVGIGFLGEKRNIDKIIY